jgi:hypothetical protein
MNATRTVLKPMNPKSADTKYVGLEPAWRTQPTADNRVSTMSYAFGWYNYFYSKKEAKDMVVAYLDAHNRTKDARQIRTLPDSQMRLTTGWLCRMQMMGLDLTEQEEVKLQALISELLALKQQTVVETVEVDEPARPNIQDRLREKASECNGELDGMFDEFMLSGAKMTADFKPVTIMRGLNVAPQMISQILDNWKRKLAEFETVIEGKDAQLVEGYSHLTKIQMRNVVKFCEAVINDCGAYVQIKKVERKPRKVKSVPPEKRAAKFKVMMEFAELKLKGLPAASLVDKAEAWLYDTKKRKLIHLVADSHTQAFTVKSQTASLVSAPCGNSCRKLCASQQMLSKQCKPQASQPHVRSTRI